VWKNNHDDDDDDGDGDGDGDGHLWRFRSCVWSILPIKQIPYLPLAINSLRWVELSVLLKSLADPEGRMRDLHLHPFSVALLSSTFVHNYFGKLEHNATDLLPALSHLPSSPLPFPLPSLPEHHQSQAEQGRRRSRRKGESVGEWPTQQLSILF